MDSKNEMNETSRASEKYECEHSSQTSQGLLVDEVMVDTEPSVVSTEIMNSTDVSGNSKEEVPKKMPSQKMNHHFSWLSCCSSKEVVIPSVKMNVREVVNPLTSDALPSEDVPLPSPYVSVAEKSAEAAKAIVQYIQSPSLK